MLLRVCETRKTGSEVMSVRRCVLCLIVSRNDIFSTERVAFTCSPLRVNSPTWIRKTSYGRLLPFASLNKAGLTGSGKKNFHLNFCIWIPRKTCRI